MVRRGLSPASPSCLKEAGAGAAGWWVGQVGSRSGEPIEQFSSVISASRSTIRS